MLPQKWLWIAIYALFVAGLASVLIAFELRLQEVRQWEADPEIKADFGGNDWLVWESSEQGVRARYIHPLPGYKPLDRERVRRGDRLRSIDHVEIVDAQAADQIVSAARPGYTFALKIERTDPYTLVTEEMDLLMRNGFRLAFSYNHFPAYWHISGWLHGLGAFLSLITLAILFPIARNNRREFAAVMAVGFAGLLFFLYQLFNHLYLIVESNLSSSRMEKVYVLLYPVFLLLYVLSYLYFKGGFRRRYLLLLPSGLASIYLIYVCSRALLERQMKYYLDPLEAAALQVALLHVGAAVLFSLLRSISGGNLRQMAGLAGVALLSLGATVYWAFAAHSEPLREHGMFVFDLLMFFPLAHATFPQLQFGRVSLVITQTIQYLVAFVVSIVLYLLVNQAFDYIRPGIQYRQLLEFAVFIVLLAVLRVVYLANENRFSRYFVSAQREKINRLKSFIAVIPQYTQTPELEADLKTNLSEFFGAEPIEIWKPGLEANALQERLEEIYAGIGEHNQVWSETKELSSLRLAPDIEKELLRSPYSLICPLKIDKDNNEMHYLLLIGKKRRGVYNLSDLELISQLVQQTQLTLNVLHLVDREKELIQQTYEANLTALRSQINPHFLFNTLNSIGELVHESADLAEQAVEKLAFIFRYTLRMSSQNFVTLGDEMSLITTYLDLEKIRFGDRLDNFISMEPEVKEVMIPAFILQTLVENCIKHGIAKILHKGRVSVKAFREEDYLVCEVVDNGPGIDLTRIHKSTGLSNSIARLENIYDVKNLLYFENTGNGTYVRLRIPLNATPRLRIS
jgi:signal transduction histidine kinase